MSQGRPEILRPPEQGWSSLLLLLGMLVLLGVSVADSRPLPAAGSASLTDSLPLVMLAAGLIGYVLARSSLGVVRAHLLGATVAAFVLLFIAGGALLDEPALPLGLDALGARLEVVWERLDAEITAFLLDDVATQTVTTFLVLGAICWTTAQFSAFSVFRYDRGGPAVMAVGTILFLNTGLRSLQDESDLLPVVPMLALFAALALLLLMRMQLMQQRYAWARRHISDARDVSKLFIRTGTAFVLIAVLSASSLTVWATVEAQDVSIDGLEEPLEDFADEVSKMLSIFGVPTEADVPASLGTTTKLVSNWTQPDGVAFTAEFTEGQPLDNYWWGKSDDFYDHPNEQWATSQSEERAVAAEDSLLSADDVSAAGPYEVEVAVTVGDSPARANLYRLPDVWFTDRDTVVREVGDGGKDAIAFADALDAGGTVAYTSWVHDYTESSESLTANMLRSATGEVPQWILDRYLQGGDDVRVIGPKTQELVAQLRQQPTAYDRALELQNHLGGMKYEAQLGDACEEFTSIPECLLTIEEGFCQQYATTMTLTLRALEIPARFVTGYLPGTPLEGVLTVENQALHNWVEAFFPGVGWVRFDPTPAAVGHGQVPTALPPGEAPGAQETLPPEPDPSEEPFETEEPEPTLEPFVPVDQVETGGGDSTGIVIGLTGLAAVLLTVVTALLLFRLRRLPEGDDGLAYRGIVSLATRLGYGPHPSQTEYEYASTLAETIPTVRDDLYVVTDARVETAYGGHDLDDQRRGPLRGAYARIRTALLRLSLRWRR